MSSTYINGKWQCYSMPDGRHKHLLGCSHDRPRQAIAHTSGSYVSPLRETLRASDEASTADPGIPLPGSGLSDASSDVLRSTSGPSVGPQ